MCNAVSICRLLYEWKGSFITEMDEERKDKKMQPWWSAEVATVKPPQVTQMKAAHPDVRWMFHQLTPSLNSPLDLRLSFCSQQSDYEEREKKKTVFLLSSICLLFAGIFFFISLCIIGKIIFLKLWKWRFDFLNVSVTCLTSQIAFFLWKGLESMKKATIWKELCVFFY